MEIWATWVQLIGNAVTAGGLLYAWNRATKRFTRWREGLAQRIGQLHALVAERLARDSVVGVDAVFGGEGSLTATADATGTGVLGRTVEERLANLERQHQQALAALPDQIDAAIVDKLGDLDAAANTFRLRDIYWTLAGLAVGGVGQVLALVASPGLN
jgi:hypothetical protein